MNKKLRNGLGSIINGTIILAIYIVLIVLIKKKRGFSSKETQQNFKKDIELEK